VNNAWQKAKITPYKHLHGIVAYGTTISVFLSQIANGGVEKRHILELRYCCTRKV